MTRNRNSAVEKQFLLDDHVRTKNLDESEKELFASMLPAALAITGFRSLETKLFESFP